MGVLSPPLSSILHKFIFHKFILHKYITLSKFNGGGPRGKAVLVSYKLNPNCWTGPLGSQGGVTSARNIAFFLTLIAQNVSITRAFKKILKLSSQPPTVGFRSQSKKPGGKYGAPPLGGRVQFTRKFRSDMNPLQLWEGRNWDGRRHPDNLQGMKISVGLDPLTTSHTPWTISRV